MAITPSIAEEMQSVSIERDASAIAWCPISNVESLNLGQNSAKCNPMYLLASVHDEVDSAFNRSSRIEILNTSPSAVSDKRNMSMGRCISKTNFKTLTWGDQTKPTSDMPLGIIAGGMNDGSVTLWNPYHLLTGKSGLMGTYSDFHKQEITAMSFNPTVAQHTFLATADKGETLYVWDLTKPSNPIAQQPPSGKAKSQSSYPKYATALSWNNNVSYILAVSNCLGQTEIYDLRNKKVALTFESKNMNRALAISWNPNKARQLAVCYSKGEAEIWDLKQPKSPKIHLRDEVYGHKRPMHDLSWNCMDSNLLLTSGDDCIGNIWNGNNGKLIHQIQFGDDPKLKVEWNNLRGGALAAISSQNISIYNVNYLGDGYCPKWMKRECGVNIGFGGKVISFGKEYNVLSRASSNLNLKDTPRTSSKMKTKLKIPPSISVQYLPKSQSMIARADQFKKTLSSLQNTQQLKAFANTKLQTLYSIKSQIQKSQSSVSKPDKPKTPKKKEDDDLDFLADLTDSEDDMDEIPQQQQQQNEQPLVPPSGGLSVNEIDFEIKMWEMIRLFFEQDCKDDIIEYLGFNKSELMQRQQTMDLRKQNRENMDSLNLNDDQMQKDQAASPRQLETHLHQQHHHEHADSESEDDFGFFDTLGDNRPSTPGLSTKHSPRQNNIPDTIKEEKKDVSDVPSQDKSHEKIEKRFENASKNDEDVRNAIIIGNYKLAINLSLEAGKIADALVFAYYAQDSELWETVSKSYFDQHSQQFIAKTFCHIAKNDYFELVAKSDLNKWKETLAILLTFTEGDDFNNLCNNLGQRILENVDNLEGAIACFLCSQNISQLIAIWTISTNKESKKPTDLVLHSAITKALIYVNAPFVEQNASSQSALSSVFCKYANLLANQGSLDVAAAFLEFASSKVGGNKNRNRIDPQIKTLINRITSSQEPGRVTQQRQDIVRNPEEYRPQNSRQRMPGPNQKQNRQRMPGPGPRNTRNQSQPSPNQPPIRNMRKTRAPKPGPGGPQRNLRPIRRNSGNGSQRQMSNEMKPGPNRQIYGDAGPKPSPSNQPMNKMPPRRTPRRGVPKTRSRGPGRPGPPSHRGGGRGGPSSGPIRTPVSNSQPPMPQNTNRQRMPPSNNPMPSGSGMNGTSMPPRNAMPNRGRGSPRRGSGSGPPSRRGSSRGGMGRGGPRMPPSNTAPVTPMKQNQQRRGPPMNNQMPNQQKQPMVSKTPSVPSRNMRGRRGRGAPPSQRGSSRGGRRGGRGGSGMNGMGRGQSQPPNMNNQQMNQNGYNNNQNNYNQMQQQQQPIDKPLGHGNEHNPSQTSHGSGFFGETPLKLNNDDEPLPDDAMDTVQCIEDYLNGITSDENIMNMLKITQRNSLKGHQTKLLKDLNEQISSNRMCSYAFSCLTDIFNLLQNKEYDQALRNITDFTKSCKSKQIKFAQHRKWVMAFQSIIRIAKAYNI